MFKLMSKEILPEEVQRGILSMEQVNQIGCRRFVEVRITGDGNLRDRMPKVNLPSWITAAKEVKMKAG